MNSQYLSTFKKYGFNFSRCVGSKSNYHDLNPENFLIFNARIYTRIIYEMNLTDIQDFFKGQEYEIWYGDLDLNKDMLNLFKVHLEIKEPLIITSECGSKIIEIGE